MMPAQPVFVFAPIAEARPVDESGTYPVPAKRENYHDEVVGLLHGFALYHDQADEHIALANEALKPWDIEVKQVARALFHPKGDMQCALCYGVFVASMEAAEKLPGFVPIFLLSPRESLEDALKGGPSVVQAVN